jgi:hypothetical protein
MTQIADNAQCGGRILSRHSSVPHRKQWQAWAVKRLDMKVEVWQPVTYQAASILLRLKGGLRQAMFSLAATLRSVGIDPALVPMLRRAAKWQHCPVWPTAKDQMIAILCKEDTHAPETSR